MSTGRDRWDEWGARRPKQPSDFLYCNKNYEGEALTFEQAMHLCVAEADAELLNWRAMQPDEFLSAAAIAHAIADLEALKVAAEEALALYIEYDDDEAGRDAVAVAFGDSSDSWKQAVAAAAFEDCYCELAI